MLNRTGGSVEASTFRGMRESALFSLICEACRSSATGSRIAAQRHPDLAASPATIARPSGATASTGIRADAGGDGPNGNGISLYKAGGVIIEGNSLRDCALTFIRNNLLQGVQILGNQGKRCGECGIYSEFAFEGAIIANNLVEDCALGASMTNLDHGGRLSVFANNIVRNARKASYPGFKDPVGGMGVHVEAEATVTGNVIENASDIGISLGWSSGHAQPRRDRQHGPQDRHRRIISVSLVPKQRNALIASNVIAEATRGAVVGTEYGKAVTGDLTKAPGCAGRRRQGRE